MKRRIIVAGDATMHWTFRVDQFPGSGEMAPSSQADWHPGGHGPVQAMAAARLGASVSLLGSLGKDGLGDLMQRALDNAGVDTSSMSRSDRVPTGQNVSWINSANQVRTVGFLGANQDWVNAPSELFSDCGIFLANSTVPIQPLETAVSCAKEAGVLVFLDATSQRPIPDTVLASVDYLLLNGDSLAVLTNAPLSDFSHASAAIKARELRTRWAATIIVQLGPLGALLVKEDMEHLWRPPNGAPGDIAQAGDFFAAALGIALTSGKTELSAGKYAVAAATVCLQRPGYAPVFPSPSEIDRLLKPGPPEK